MMTVKVPINEHEDRKNMVYALANNNCKVWIEIDRQCSSTEIYLVCFEVEEYYKKSGPLERIEM
jgi:hypothetical protein